VGVADAMPRAGIAAVTAQINRLDHARHAGAFSKKCLNFVASSTWRSSMSEVSQSVGDKHNC